MADEILVSVVLPFYNGRAFILETLESVARQSFAQFEVVIVDDGSADKSQSLHLRDLVASMGDARFRYFHKDNGGLSDARNFGLRQTRGAWIAFIDQDDVWDREKLAKQVAVVRAHPDVDFVFTDGKLIGDARGGMGVASKNGLDEGVVRGSYTKLLKGNFVICSSVFFRKSLLDAVGYSSTVYKIVPDYEYILRFAERTDFYFMREELVSYRIHGSNTVKNQLKQSAEVLLLLCERRLTTREQKIRATINLVRTSLALAACWLRKIGGR